MPGSPLRPGPGRGEVVGEAHKRARTVALAAPSLIGGHRRVTCVEALILANANANNGAGQPWTTLVCQLRGIQLAGPDRRLIPLTPQVSRGVDLAAPSLRAGR